MFQKRSLTTGFLVASLGFAAGLAVMASPDVASADDCGKYKTAEVKAVCAKGGKKAVEKAMKKATGKAKDAKVKIDGKTISCDSCHEGKDKALKGNAEADFKKHLASGFGS